MSSAAYYAAHRVSHREERRAYGAAYRAAHREETRAYNAAYVASHREENRSYSAVWRAAHPGYQTAYNANYAAAHPEEIGANNARRRARKTGNGGSHTLQEWQDKCALLGNVCAYCGEAKPLARDHDIPLSRGGTDDIMNIFPACRSCNSRKGTKTADEFIASRKAS